jgi:ABC-type phosphate/phosphonate transport system substrate-binding protein
MNRKMTCSVAVLVFGVAACRNSEPPARAPETPPAPSSSNRALLEAIDREFLPAVRSTDVKDLLQTVRARVESHLTEAEQIQKGLGG